MSKSPKTSHSGSSFDSFLEEENLLQDVEAVAIKRVIAWQLQEAMKQKRITKQRMAQHLKTSRSQVDRLLDPVYVNIGLDTVSRAAHALGKKIQIELVDARPRAKKPQRKGPKPSREAKLATRKLAAGE